MFPSDGLFGLTKALQQYLARAAPVTWWEALIATIGLSEPQFPSLWIRK